MPYLFYRYSVMDLRWRSFARELLQRQRDPWKDTSDEDMIHILCRFDNWSTRVLQTKSREFLLAMCSANEGRPSLGQNLAECPFWPHSSHVPR